MATRNKKTDPDIEYFRKKLKNAKSANEAEQCKKQIEMLEDGHIIYNTNVAYKIPLTAPKAVPLQVVKTNTVKTRKLKASWKVPSFNVYIDDDEE